VEKEIDEKKLQGIFESPAGVAELLRSAAHPARIRILGLLLQGKRNFSQIMQHTRLSKTALANHMSHLIRKGLVTRVTRGEYDLTVDGKELLNAAASVYMNSSRRADEQREQLHRLYTEGLIEGKKLDRKVVSKKAEYLPCWLSYTGAIGGALKALGVDCDIVDVGGRSGYSFLINVSKGRTCPSGPTALPEGTWKQIHKGVEALGWTMEAYVYPSSFPAVEGKPTPKEVEVAKNLFEKIKKEIEERDRPVVLWGLVAPEYGIVNGYEGNSYIVSTFRSIIKQPETPIIFYDLKAAGCIDAFFFRDKVKADALKADREALKNAIRFAEAKVPILRNYVGGPDALDEWADVLEKLLEEEQDYFGNSYVGACVAEGRALSAKFLERLANKHSGKQSKHLREAAACYEKGGGLMEEFTKIFPFHGPGQQGKMKLADRKKGAGILRKVKVLEQEAVQHMKKALVEWRTL